MKTLESLEQVCWRYKNIYANLILLEDFNAHIEEDKIGQKWNKRSRKLQLLCSRLMLVPVNYFHFVTLHVPRTCHESRSGNTIVDYIILDRDLVQSMTSSRVLNEHPENVAYHLPLIINLCMTHKENIGQPCDERSRKHMRKLDTSCWENALLK